MRWFSFCLGFPIWFLHCTAKESGLKLAGFYYEYMPDWRRWSDARRECQQKAASLADLLQDSGNQEMMSYLQSLNVTQPVWIESKVSEGDYESLILEFSGRSQHTCARIKQSFPSLSAVTLCAHLQFDPATYGVSNILSYSTWSSPYEFQLRAVVTSANLVKLALLMHGRHEPYSAAFKNDGLWHLVCVSWTGDAGKWFIAADGRRVGQGGEINTSGNIAGEGLLVIGQVQESLGNFSESEKGFSGNITQLNVWDRVLSISEIRSLEKGCSLNSSGLLFKWNSSALEMDVSLKRHWGDLCGGPGSELESRFIHKWLDSELAVNVFVPEVIYVPRQKKCVTFDPLTGKLSQDFCEKEKGAICQYEKDAFERHHSLIVFPKTSLFSSVKDDLLTQSVAEEHWLNLAKADVAQLTTFIRVLLRVLEKDPAILTPIDMWNLTQIVDLVSVHVSKRPLSSELITPLATKILQLASEIIDPELADRWMDLNDKLGSIGLFNVIKSIDKLTGTLADVLSAEGTGFNFSTKNIDVHMEQQNLRELNHSCVFRPSVPGGRDEIAIPDTEILRLRSLGHEEVIFIHVYYRNVTETMSKRSQSPSSTGEKGSGRLATAIISATVRDSFRRQNVPVSVRYTLSSINAVDSPLSVRPACVFWNSSLMSEHLDGWSNEGCQVIHAGSAVTSCFCSHTTNFAVLMNYMEVKWSGKVDDILTKLTFIGCGASLCALIVTLMLFMVLDIPRSDRTTVHKNLFLALAAAQTVLLCSGSVTINAVACTLVAALLHLFFMAAFTWMLVEGLLLWSKVVAVNLSEAGHMKYYYFIGWGLPVLVVAITLALASGKYSGDSHCWLSVQNGVIWGFVGPVIVIITVNIMVLSRVVVIAISTAKRRSIMLALKSAPLEQACEQTRATAKAVMVLLPILGLTWLCGLLVPFSTVMAFLFVLLNSLQGLFIFLIYGVYNTEVRSTINKIKERRKARNLSRPPSSVNSSQLAGIPLPGGGSHSLDEGVDCPSSSQLSSQPTALDASEDSYEDSVCADGGHRPDPSAQEYLGEAITSPAPSVIIPVKDPCCVLHVTMPSMEIVMENYDNSVHVRGR